MCVVRYQKIREKEGEEAAHNVFAVGPWITEHEIIRQSVSSWPTLVVRDKELSWNLQRYARTRARSEVEHLVGIGNENAR